MNSLIIDKDNNLELKDNALKLNIKVKELTLNIKGKVLINEIDNLNNEELNLTINMLPNSSLIYNRFIIHHTMNNKITINQDNNSNIIFNYSLISKDKCNLTINTNLKGSNNETELNIKTVTLDNGSTIIKGEADVSKNIKDNNLLESIKTLILNDSNNTIIPNLLVSSDNVTVNHAATLSNIDSDYLFYLNSKGINNEDATRLIRNGFLISNLKIDKETYNEINELLEGE